MTIRTSTAPYNHRKNITRVGAIKDGYNCFYSDHYASASVLAKPRDAVKLFLGRSIVMKQIDEGKRDDGWEPSDQP